MHCQSLIDTPFPGPQVPHWVTHMEPCRLLVCSLIGSLQAQMGTLVLLTAAAVYPVIIAPVMGASRAREVQLHP